jgi:hypothetical protein
VSCQFFWLLRWKKPITGKVDEPDDGTAGSGRLKFMATKAELEIELAKLKLQLAESQVTAAASQVAENAPGENSAETAPEATELPASGHSHDPDEGRTASDHDLSEVEKALRHGDLGGLAQQMVEELEGLPQKKPLLTALGALILGYLIGRSR